VHALSSAEIVAVGSELLTSARLDTNSLHVAGRLNELGIVVRAKHVVGDSRSDLLSVFREALDRSDLIVLTGGLGPTDDDLTRDVVAEALGRPLSEDAGIVQRIQQRFSARGLEMPAINRRQAMVPEGAELLPNTAGTAPGLWIEHRGRIVVLLPGPPRELKPMMDAVASERLSQRVGAERVFTGMVRVAGQTESHAEAKAQPLYERWRRDRQPITVTTLTAPASIDFHVVVRAPDMQGLEQLSRAVDELCDVFGEDAYARDDRGMEHVVGAMLRERHYTIAAAESCTGGLLTSRLTDVPGSSAWVDRAVVVYSNAAKTELLGVPTVLIEADGAVSESVAAAMAEAVRARAGTTIGVAITGIAGPDGATPGKPVGTVCMAVTGPWGTSVRTRLLPGGREQVKFFATQGTLDDLRRALLHWN
jgi:nicotinamide-nucleotide amidase